MKWTVFGANGFIGSYLVLHLKEKNYQVAAINRDIKLNKENLGHVVYCAGVTADFRSRPFDTVEAHVNLPARLMKESEFESFLYLSSTRVYQRSTATNESCELNVLPQDSSDLYNISKLMGESVCLSSGRKNVRIARLSNILGFHPGNNNFIDSLLAEALTKGAINLQSDPRSGKDYLFIDELTPLLEEVSLTGRQPIYNLASGLNISNSEITDMIKAKLACSVSYLSGAPTIAFPLIDNRCIREEFAFSPSDFKNNLYKLIDKLADLLAT